MHSTAMHSLVIVYFTLSPYNTKKINFIPGISLLFFHYAKTLTYLIMINDNILLVYLEAYMTRTKKKDEFITRSKQYFVLGWDEISALMVYGCT